MGFIIFSHVKKGGKIWRASQVVQARPNSVADLVFGQIINKRRSSLCWTVRRRGKGYGSYSTTCDPEYSKVLSLTLTLLLTMRSGAIFFRLV
jgi:hypothetical protein